MAFPATPLALRVEVAPGADLTANPSTYSWTDITADLRMDDPITVTAGSADEQSETQSSLALVLRDDSGTYTVANPMSSLYPYMDVGLPIRLSVDVGSGWVVLCVQYLTSATPIWPDNSSRLALSAIEAHGLIVRLQAGAGVASPMRRRIPAESTQPIAWWPCEDGQYSTEAASAIDGVAALTTVGSLPTRFGQTAAEPASSPLPDLAAGGSLTGLVPVSATTTVWTVAAVVVLDPTSTSNATPFSWTVASGTLARYYVTAFRSTDVMQVVWDDGLGSTATLFPIPSVPVIFDGQPHMIVVSGTQNGADIDYVLTVDGVAYPTMTFSTGTNGPVSSVTANHLAETDTGIIGVGHLLAYDTDSPPDLWAPASGHVGEQAHTRLARVAAEDGVPYSSSATSSVAMGPQPIAALVPIMRECEATDHGILDDSQGRLTYYSQRELYNQSAALTIDASARELAGPVVAVRDTLRFRNRVVADRPGGGSAAAQDDTHITRYGTYAVPTTVNVDEDRRLIDHATWSLYEGTLTGYRVPRLALNLHAAGAPVSDWLAMTLGSLIALSSPPTRMSTADLRFAAIGWTQTILGRRGPWRAAINVLPYRWDVSTVESNRVDTLLSTLTSAITSTATSLSITSTGGVLWTTDSADFPMDVNIGGEQITLSAITGASSPQTGTVSARSVNGVTKAHSAGAQVRVWQPTPVAL